MNTNVNKKYIENIDFSLFKTFVMKGSPPRGPFNESPWLMG
jgi:hypothetical protein